MSAVILARHGMQIKNNYFYSYCGCAQVFDLFKALWPHAILALKLDVRWGIISSTGAG